MQPGSNFAVKNLFFNVPARRKFLKNNQIEYSNVANEFERIALANTEVEFVLTHDDKEVYRLFPGSLRQRIVALFGKSFNQQLLPVEVQTSVVTINGYVGKPEAARKRGALQYLFVNGRYMRHPGFHKAIMKAYEELIPEKEMPNYFLFFTVAPETIDVNIHPTKTEIKFENEQAIWPIVMAAVKEALGKFCAAPSIDFDMADAPEIPAFTANIPVIPPSRGYDPSYNPFKKSGGAGGSSVKRPDYDWQKLYAGFNDAKNDIPVADEGCDPSRMQSAGDAIFTDEDSINSRQPGLGINLDSTMSTSLFLQFKGRYIVTPSKTGLLLVDQHRAHVRVLYEQYMARREKQTQLPSQKILYPELIHLSPSKAALMDDVQPVLQQLGFDISDMGNGSYSVCGVPVGIEGIDIHSLLEQMFLAADSKERSVADDLFMRLALSLAESVAIPVGQVLSGEEMERLIGDLFGIATPNYTPDGKPVFTIITTEEIAKRM